jgi:hypothetical protein
MTKVKLGLNELSVPKKIVFAENIVLQMTNNAWFQDPNPKLTDVTDAITVLSDKAAKALKGGASATQQMYEAEKKLVQLLIPLGYYVETIANANPDQADAIIVSAGMQVRSKGKINIPILSVKAGAEPGAAIVRRKAQRGYAYHLQYSTAPNDNETWVDVATSTLAKIKVEGLVSLTRYYFRVALIKGSVQEDYCDPITFVVS